MSNLVLRPLGRSLRWLAACGTLSLALGTLTHAWQFPRTLRRETLRGGCVSASTCITFDAAHGPDGGTIVLPAVPPDATPVFAYLYFQYLTTTGCGVSRTVDFALATVNGVNINTLPFEEVRCLDADPCFPASATHFYRVEVTSLFPVCGVGVGPFELRGFGTGNSTSGDWVEGATLMLAYCSASAPVVDMVLIEHPQVVGEGPERVPFLEFAWDGFLADGAAGSLSVVVGNGQSASELVLVQTSSTRNTPIGSGGDDGLFDGQACVGGAGLGGYYDDSVLDVASLLNAGDRDLVLQVRPYGVADWLDGSAALLCVSSQRPGAPCTPQACCFSGAVIGYGTGHPGTNGIPDLSVVGCPTIGRDLEFRLSGGPAGARACFAGASSPAMTPFLGATLLLGPPFVLVEPQVLDDMGEAVLRRRIPHDPALVNVPFFFQSFIGDPAASQGVSATRGIAVVVGS